MSEISKNDYEEPRCLLNMHPEVMAIPTMRVIDKLDEYLGENDYEGAERHLKFWLHIPQCALADAVNGEMYFDNFGEFTTIREVLNQMPQDVFLKRLAGNLLIMAQSGQYNYTRCIRHGETEAAQLACVEFVKATMESLFLLSGKYMPYYKWSFRALRDIEGMGENADTLIVTLCE